MADARASVTAMIEAAGVKGKVVALIIPNEYRPDTRVHLNAHGRQLVTLWGRTPATDEGTVKELIAAAKQAHGEIFIGSASGRIGADIILDPYVRHCTAPVPPRTWE
jgi:hypothetical protein